MIVYFYLPSVFLRARKKYDVLSFLCLGFFHQSDGRALGGGILWLVSACQVNKCPLGTLENSQLRGYPLVI